MRQELTIFSAGAVGFITFIALVVLIITISTAVSSVIAIFNGFPQLSSAICEAAGSPIWIGGMVVFLIFALVGAFCFKVTK